MDLEVQGMMERHLSEGSQSATFTAPYCVKCAMMVKGFADRSWADVLLTQVG